MLDTKITCLALIGAVVLTACGGGGGDDEVAIDARSKYIGDWQTGCSLAQLLPGGIAQYEKEVVEIRLQGASSVVITSTEHVYLDGNCTLPATPALGDVTSSTLTFVGTKSVDDKVVDKARAALADLAPNTTVPAIIYTAENKLYTQINRPNRPVAADSEGFPIALDLNSYITKVSN